MKDYSGGVSNKAQSPLKITMSCKQLSKIFPDTIIGEKEEGFKP
jgi:hypothetical protein